MYTLAGKDIGFWLKLLAVLQEYNIEDSKELKEILSGTDRFKVMKHQHREEEYKELLRQLRDTIDRELI